MAWKQSVIAAFRNSQLRARTAPEPQVFGNCHFDLIEANYSDIVIKQIQSNFPLPKQPTVTKSEIAFITVGPQRG